MKNTKCGLYGMQVKDEMLAKAKTDPILQKLKQETGIDYPAPVMGKWHYFYYSDDGKKKISLVELLDAYSPWKKDHNGKYVQVGPVLIV